MKIAVVGSGISGLGAAYLLSRGHDVHLFEASSRLGGHAHTVHVDDDGRAIPMDTGFLVYNELTYPHLKGFFAHLDVKTVNSDMSLSIRNVRSGLEWAGTNMNTVFAQRGNLFKISFYSMLFEILRFHREVEENLGRARRHGWTLGDLLREQKYKEGFARDYLLPMAAAIWSTPENDMLAFPAATFLNFLINHKLVQVNDRPIWRTVAGGSIQYVDNVARRLPNVHLNSPVSHAERVNGRVRLKVGGEEVDFDQVIFATHAPVTARILRMDHEDEREVLSSFAVEPNRAVLHQDRKLMPKLERVWSAWNVFGTPAESLRKVSLSYHLNRLQPLATKKDFFLTLNPQDAAEQVAGEYHYEHPRFDQVAIRAQSRLPDIQGRGGVYFAGAWTRYGFHEDGLLSAVKVARQIGVNIPWEAV